MKADPKNVLVMTRDQQHYTLRFINPESAANAVGFLRRQPDIIFAYRVRADHVIDPPSINDTNEKFVAGMLALL